jgi:hypothetical protein
MYFLANSTRKGELSIPMIFLTEYAWATAAVIRPIGPHPLSSVSFYSIQAGHDSSQDS